MQPLVIGGHPLEYHDADRLIDQGAAAGTFTGMRADTTTDCRNRHVAANSAERLVVAVVLDFLDIGRDINVCRATIHAGGRQLVAIGFGPFAFTLSTQVGQIVITKMFNGIDNRFGGRHA